jgi:hypothetical protein
MLFGDRELVSQVTKFDFEVIEKCGNPDKPAAAGIPGNKNSYKKAIESAFFSSAKSSGMPAKSDPNAILLATPEERAK